MTAWQWLLAHSSQIAFGVTVWLLTCLALVALLFWRNRKRPADEIPASDQALADLTDEEFRARVGLPQRKEGEPQ